MLYGYMAMITYRTPAFNITPDLNQNHTENNPCWNSPNKITCCKHSNVIMMSQGHYLAHVCDQKHLQNHQSGWQPFQYSVLQTTRGLILSSVKLKPIIASELMIRTRILVHMTMTSNQLCAKGLMQEFATNYALWTSNC